MSVDRSSNTLLITQEAMSNLLGVRRESVTQTLGQLQKDGLISRARGRITVIDRPKLELRVCECYGVVRDEYERLLPCKKTSKD